MSGLDRFDTARCARMSAKTVRQSGAIGCNRDKGARDDFIDELAGKTVRVVRKRAHTSSPGFTGCSPGYGCARGGKQSLVAPQSPPKRGRPPPPRQGAAL